ncbi:hypothetical protein SETIT_1G235200v2 [Setaria italica]|uniref:Uncharacterized protein n=1 Tax=Setaria italica TaxID=4555 RepID=A0A368PQP8_SETIT|nr:uncharacterized protein LOC101763439 [Setaria italica]RCV07330.1 hypothetical protein SETIT_1G235200v2 [Setaria italica]
MAAVRGGFSSGGSTNTRRAGHLLPFPCNREPAAASCASSGSSPARSKATRAATCYGADAKLKPEVEASAGNNTKMLLAISATGGSSPRYGSRPPHSDRAGSLTHPSPASPSSCIRGGGGYRQTHGGEDASSSVTRRLEKGQGRLPTRADFMKPSSTLRTIRLQTTRHPSLLDRRGSVNDLRFPKARGKENEVCDKNNWQTDTVSSCLSSARDQNFESDGAFKGSNHSAMSMKPSAMLQNIRIQTPRHRCLLDRRVEGGNQVPPRSIHKAVPARLMHQGPSHNCHQHEYVIDPINDSIVPEVSEEEDEVNEQDWQTDTAPTHISSACDESDGAFEGRKHSAHLVKPSAMPRNIRLQIPRHPSLLSRRVDRINQVPFMCGGCSSDNNHQHVDALDTIDEWRLHKGCVVTTKCIGQSSSTASNSSKFAPLSLGKVKDKAAIVRSASAHKSGGTVGARKKEAYITTLGTGGGYGDPHPPPFYKCEACHKGTAFYRLKCCRLVVCERCGCACEPAEAVEDEKLQSRRGKVQAGKERLPKVKLEGSDLFLWQPCSFPAGLMLCVAKRTGNYLQYYFAPVDDLMNPKVKGIKATVYTFRQHGRNARSLSVRDELLTREQLR